MLVLSLKYLFFGLEHAIFWDCHIYAYLRETNVYMCPFIVQCFQKDTPLWSPSLYLVSKVRTWLTKWLFHILEVLKYITIFRAHTQRRKWKVYPVCSLTTIDLIVTYVSWNDISFTKWISVFSLFSLLVLKFA